MTDARLERIAAYARLDSDPEEELARAREASEAGDESWDRWIEEVESGDALLVELFITADVRDHADVHRLRGHNRAVWLENDAHPPKVEEQIREIASKDFGSLSRALEGRGVELSPEELTQMFVHVELGDDLRERLAARRDAAKRDQTRVGLTPP